MNFLFKSTIICAALCLSTTASFAQFEAHNWVFGNGAGIKFSTTSPFAPTNIGSMGSRIEGIATMSDVNGNLICYSTGGTVWDAVGNTVSNTLLGHHSATQSSIIVPDPVNSNEYYLFTVDKFAESGGLQYVKYDALTSSLVSSSILLETSVTEKITAVKKSDNSGYWVLTHDWENNDFIIYEITSAGLSFHSTQSAGVAHEGHFNSTVGYMKFSTDGTRLAVANTYGNWAGSGFPSSGNSYGFVQVFDFDALTGTLATSGIVSIGLNGTTDDGSTLFTPYGLEFSKNSDFLYIGELGQLQTSSGSIYQYEFSTSSLRTIGTASGISYNIGALQMGPDGKIYVSIDELDYLGVINDPEVAIATNGNDFSVAANQFTLTLGTARLGLPNVVQSIFQGKPNAIEDSELEVTIGLELYPSPTASTLSIQIDRTASKLTVKVFNTEGRMADVHIIYTTGTMLELDVEQLSSGLYFVEVNADGNIAKGKFVRQ
jgi:hypothetical protein